MKKFEVYVHKWVKRTCVLSIVMLTIARLSAQDVSVEPTGSLRDSLLSAGTQPVYTELTLPDILSAVPHKNATTFTSPFKSMSIEQGKIFNHPHSLKNVTPYPTYSLTTPVLPSIPNKSSIRIPMNSSGNMTLFTKGRYTLGLTGSNNSYPSMGFSNSIMIRQDWAVSDRITLSGGVYASDNLFHRNRFKDFGVSGRVQIKVADRVTLSGYGVSIR